MIHRLFKPSWMPMFGGSTFSRNKQSVLRDYIFASHHISH
jgi:hypothetical protein